MIIVLAVILIGNKIMYFIMDTMVICIYKSKNCTICHITNYHKKINNKSHVRAVKRDTKIIEKSKIWGQAKKGFILNFNRHLA